MLFISSGSIHALPFCVSGNRSRNQARQGKSTVQVFHLDTLRIHSRFEVENDHTKLGLKLFLSFQWSTIVHEIYLRALQLKLLSCLKWNTVPAIMVVFY